MLRILPCKAIKFEKRITIVSGEVDALRDVIDQFHDNMPSFEQCDGMFDMGYSRTDDYTYFLVPDFYRPGEFHFHDPELIFIKFPECGQHPRDHAIAKITSTPTQYDVGHDIPKIVIMTFSSLLLLDMQVSVANGVYAPDDVALWWFDENGLTIGELDKNGAYGDWPENLSDFELTAHKQYAVAENEMGGEDEKI